MEPGGRRSPGLYSNIPVLVLQVPAGEEGGPRGVPNLPKEDKKEEDYEEKDDEEKKEDYEEKKVVDDFLFVPLPFVSFPCITKHLAKLLYQLIYRTHIIDINIEFFKAFS